MPRPVRMLLITIDLIERLLDLQSAAFQFHLHQRQSINEQSYIITVVITPLHPYLLSDLKDVLLRMKPIQQLHRACLTLAIGISHPIPQDFGTIENTALIDIVQNLLELMVR